MLAGIAVGLAALALPRTSRVHERIVLLQRATRSPAAAFRSKLGRHALSLRIALAAIGALLALFASVPFVAPALAYAGFVLPSIASDRHRRTALAEAEQALILLVERLEALVAAGRPPETAIALLAEHPTGSVLLDRILSDTAAAYALSAPLFRSLAMHAGNAGVVSLHELATELDRARDLGKGSALVVRDARDVLRGHERSRRLDAAARVDTRLMLILVLCYLPALLLAVIVPLFLGLLAGLGG